MSDSTVEFRVLCEMLDAVAKNKKSALKRKNIRIFLEHVYTDHEYFSAMRLILPELDRERGNYGLKEQVLARCLSDALGLAKDAEDAKRLLNWRKGGAQVGVSAGNFSLVASEVLHRRQRVGSKGFKIKEVNDSLDRLAAAKNREEKTTILAELINKTNAQEMKWIIMIILKDLKLGISEKTIFHEFHPDAEDLFNVTCDLKLVCTKLADRNQRYNRQDIEVGKAVRPQLAARVPNMEAAWKKLRGKRIVAECKFDGDRIQIHKNGEEIHYFSRTFIDHDEFKHAMQDVIRKNVILDRCILDGEILVWNRITNRFADFGTIQEIAKAAKEGLDSDQQLCYVTFDILYAGDTSVIHQPLYERHSLLRKSVNPVKGSLEILLPDEGLNQHRSPGEPLWSVIVSNAEEAEHFFQATVENRDEGIVLKDLDSKWEPGDRSGKWIKLKPDYIHAGSDLDVLIIGGYYGSGRHGGEVAQFLLGIAERPESGGYPTRFLSFCRVGTGISDDDLNTLVTKLKPYLRRNEKNMKAPSFYKLTNSAKERPDVWVDQPDKSVILEITSDIRTIKSEVFAAPYSLRFPRVHRVRYDKPWYDCLDVQALVELVHSRSGNTVDAQTYKALGQKSKRGKADTKARSRLPVVPSHMIATDVTNIQKSSSIFKDLIFYFPNIPEGQTKESVHKLIVGNGGGFSMNLNQSVTHVVAANKKGIQYGAAAKHGDIIHFTWLMDCIAQKELLPLRPKYLLQLSTSSKDKARRDMDEFGDYYCLDVDYEDLKQILNNVPEDSLVKDKIRISHYKRKYCSDSWNLFQGCVVYFLDPESSLSSDDILEIAQATLKRLEMEIQMREGTVCSTLDEATHIVVLVAENHEFPFEVVFNSFSEKDRQLVILRRIEVVKHAWLEDALRQKNRPAETDYSLRNEQFIKLAEDQMHVHETEEEKKIKMAPSLPVAPVPTPKEPKRHATRRRPTSMAPSPTPIRLKRPATKRKPTRKATKLSYENISDADGIEVLCVPEVNEVPGNKETEANDSKLMLEPLAVKQDESVYTDFLNDLLPSLNYSQFFQDQNKDQFAKVTEQSEGEGLKIDVAQVAKKQQQQLPYVEEPLMKKKKTSYKDIVRDLL